MIAKPLPATSTTTPMTTNKGAFMCDLRYLRSPPEPTRRWIIWAQMNAQ